MSILLPIIIYGGSNGRSLPVSRQAQHPHQAACRPWASYAAVEKDKRSNIKGIEVKSVASLSLQVHDHRSEHWVVVKGVTNVVNGEKEFYLRINESTFILAGNKHRLESPSISTPALIKVHRGESV